MREVCDMVSRGSHNLITMYKKQISDITYLNYLLLDPKEQHDRESIENHLFERYGGLICCSSNNGYNEISAYRKRLSRDIPPTLSRANKKKI